MPIDDEEDEGEQTRVGKSVEFTAVRARLGKSQRPWLVVVSGTHSIGKMYRLEHPIVLGRSPQCDVQIDEDGVSRRHAQLERTPEGTVVIVDLSSRNGTFVNGEPVLRETLRDGDKIQIGGTTILKLSYQDELDEALQRNLYESATRDPLTHAINKRGFGEALDKEFAFAKRHGGVLSFLAFDIDHFKKVNDTYGHSAGDYVLRRLAEVVQASVRSEDAFARVGGEEFAILLRNIPLKHAVECAERIRASIERSTFEVGGKRIPVTISVGVTTLVAAKHAIADSLVESADKALYQAKHSGRNRICVAEGVSGPDGG